MYFEQEPQKDTQHEEALYEAAAALSLSEDLREEIVRSLKESLPLESINLIPLRSRISIDDLREVVPEGPIAVCDFYIDDIELADAVAGGYWHQEEDLLNIDHHAPTQSMFRFVSSGSLAIEYVTEHGPLTDDTALIINHTDCDSMVSALIMRGIIPAHQVFDDAVIAADHTGAEHPIADLLQALDVARDPEFSARNLALLLEGAPLEEAALALYQRRMEGRRLTEEHIQRGSHWNLDEIYVVPYIKGLRSEFLPALLPNAAVIMTVDEDHKLDGRKTSRLRLGEAAPEGFTLFDLQMSTEVDTAFGGRWNAGSNKRGGGTDLDAGDYATRVYEQYSRWLTERGQGPSLDSVHF